MASRRSKRSTTYDQFRDAIKDLDESSSDYTIPQEKSSLARVFMGYWDSNDAAAAMSYLKFMEIRTKLRMLQQTCGFWRPPPEVASYLKKRPKPTTFSVQPNTQEARDLKLVLHILGVSPHDNKPFKQFLKSKTIRQKRYWLYKHLGPQQAPVDEYFEPICETRLKRLYHFFPDRFRDEDGIIYFNSKVLLYEEKSNLFYLGMRSSCSLESGDSSESDDTGVTSSWKPD